MIKYVLIYVLSVFISSVSQILLKISTKHNYNSVWREYLNFWVISAYCIFFCSSILTIYAYKYVPLSMGPVIEALGYIFITILGFLCLHETVGRKKVLGIVCILVGIMISNL